MKKLRLVLFFALVALSLAACGDDDEGGSGSANNEVSNNDTTNNDTTNNDTTNNDTTNNDTTNNDTGDYEGPVIEIAARSIVDQETFERLSPELVAFSEEQSGFVASREYVSFLSFAPDPEPEAPIRVGLGQYASVESYNAIAQAAFADPDLAATFQEYLGAIENLGGVSNVIVRPLDPNTRVDVANMVSSGQVLELAIRDLDQIEDDVAFFEAKEDFIEVLTSADGVIREFEWVSATDQNNYYVGMTLYESLEAFAAVSQNPEIVGSPAAAAFFTNYPPLVAQITIPLEDHTPAPTTVVRESGSRVIVRALRDGARVHTYISPIEAGASATHVIETENALLVVDSQWFGGFALDFRAYIDSLGKPIDRVIVTHGHLDHYFGLTAGFRDADVYALAETKALIEAEIGFLFPTFGEEFGYGDFDTPIVPQNVLDEGELSVDGLTYRVSSVANAESEQEVLIELLGQDVWVAGDLVYNDVHLYLEERELGGWIAALGALRSEEPALVLAGHGTPGGVETIEFNIAYLEAAESLLETAESGEAYKSAIIAAYPELGGEFFFDIFLPSLFPVDTTDDVVEIAVRRLNVDQDLADFASARDTFVGLLREQEGVGVDREFEAFFNFGTNQAPDPAVFIGMTQYGSAEVFGEVGQTIGGSAEAGAFFSTFTPEAFTALRPLEAGQPVDLAAIASEPGQVLEVAVRDLSTYENFVQSDYEQARDNFLGLLRDQPGFVAEYQWVSALDPNIVVGMTVYESQSAFFDLLASEDFLNAPQTAAFLFGYAPGSGYVNTVVR